MQLEGGYNSAPNPNKKLYNAGSEWQDDIEGLADYYSTFFREYDPIIGRFNGVDPMSSSLENWTTYHYSYNNPVNFNDPNGDMARAEFINALKALWNNGGGTYTSSTREFNFDTKNALMTAAESILGFTLSEFEDGNGGDKGNRYITTARRAVQIYNAGLFSRMNLQNINYNGKNELQFSRDIDKIAATKVGAVAIATIETSKINLVVSDAISYEDSYTAIAGKTVFTFYAGGQDKRNLLQIIDVPSYIVLAHEIFHGLDKRSEYFNETNYLWRYDKTDPMYNQPKLSSAMGYSDPKNPAQITTDVHAAYLEFRAVFFENIIRDFYHLDTRRYYGQVELKPYYSQMHW